MRLAVALALTTAACSGCGGGGGTPDGSPDASHPDARPDAGPSCTGAQFFTGEVIDFDSSPTTFLGVLDANLALRGEASCTDLTSPNGRFELHLPVSDVIVDVDAPDTYVDGLVVVPHAVVSNAASLYSMRTFTAARATAFYQSLAETFDLTKGQVIVYQANGTQAYTLTGANGTVVGTDDGAVWAAGNANQYILFTNVEVGTGMQTLDGPAGTTIGEGPIPIVAGKITFVTTLF